ncbi:MAG: 3-deoxy-manno-octulosonate cytidylyltransferase [Magnetococcales bacterium]|nr:3-deoxy-manno-octulosonate cytidylyltransferase [Magnetococcales bacterium]NGZ26541.1 3-deoxy-manno-octulosonate cytidylyltransferase [Magnetococcales bacterium]
MGHPQVAVVIPARYASSRLPGKPLLDINGKPMIRHVWERASQCRADRVVVATDDERIADVVRGFGGQVVMTSADHTTGTDRVAEAARLLGAEILINVQGDEPLLDAGAIDALIRPMVEDERLPMATLAHPIASLEELSSPDVVKVVCNVRGNALYFSRSPLPYQRDGGPSMDGVLRHMGIYGYRADFLQTYARLPPTPLEQREKLEQLRALENGYAIRVVVVEKGGMGVDTPADLAKVRLVMANP